MFYRSYITETGKGKALYLHYTDNTKQLAGRRVGNKQYEQKGHLGNVRAVVSDERLTEQPKVLTASNYYPFGMLQPNNPFSSGDYRFGFQGQEQDNELKGTGNMINYKYRVHDVRIGRFLSIDPLTKSYPMLTPYQYASNTPIAMLDIDGLEGVQYLEINNKKDGTTKIKRVVEVDIHIAVTNTKEGKKLGHFKVDEFETVKAEINSEFNKGKFVDEDGFDVEFRFSFSKFDPEKVKSEDKAKGFRDPKARVMGDCPNICIGVSSIDNVVIRQSKGMGNVQGRTTVNHIALNKSAGHRSHTLGHELAHFFALRSPKNPSGNNIVEHNTQGGIWKYYGKDEDDNYIEWDIETGNYVPGIGPEDLTQDNVDVILKSVPEIDAKEINEP